MSIRCIWVYIRCKLVVYKLYVDGYEVIWQYIRCIRVYMGVYKVYMGVYKVDVGVYKVYIRCIRGVYIWCI